MTGVYDECAVVSAVTDSDIHDLTISVPVRLKGPFWRKNDRNYVIQVTKKVS